MVTRAITFLQAGGVGAAAAAAAAADHREGSQNAYFTQGRPAFHFKPGHRFTHAGPVDDEGSGTEWTVGDLGGEVNALGLRAVG